MKKSITLFLSLFLFITLQAQVSKIVTITAGGLNASLTSSEKRTITQLKVLGTINASDLFLMRDSLPKIETLILSDASVISPLDSIPDRAFYKMPTIKYIIFPGKTTYIGTAACLGCTSLDDVWLPNTLKELGSSAFSLSHLATIELPATIAKIGGACFWQCSNLTKATVPYTNDGGDFFMGCNNLSTIIVPEGVTKIKDGAFYQLTSMKNITIPSTVTSIGVHAFYNCTNLDSITIPEGVTSIASGAFWECNKMKSVKLPVTLTNIDESGFAHCRSLTSVVLPVTITNIKSSAFIGCSGLITITTPTTNGIYGGNIFEGCTNIKNIIIPEGTIAIKNNAFYSYFAGVTSVRIPSTVKTIGDNAFFGCSGIDSISLPTGVTTIGTYAFSGCGKLKSLKLPDSVTQLGIYAFSNCSNLNSINFPATMTSIPEGIFSGCTRLPTFRFSGLITTIGTKAFSGCALLDSLVIPNTITSIGESSFSGCTSIKTISIPGSVKTISLSAFTGCTGLSKVILSPGITSIGSSAFSGCILLNSITFPTSLSSIGQQAFSGTGLTSINIPAGITSIGYNAFQNCTALQIATTPYTYYQGNLFPGCVNLKTIIIPEGTTSIQDNAFNDCITVDSIRIPVTVKSIGNFAFYNCTVLKSITLPEGVLSLGSYSFANCGLLKKFIFPTTINSIGEFAFASCKGLISLSLPTKLISIPTNCFYKCAGLKSIFIPESVQSINESALAECIGLTSITVNGTVPANLNNSQYVFNNINKISCKLFVPFGTKALYGAAGQWKDFTNIVESTEGFLIDSYKVQLFDSVGYSAKVSIKANVAWAVTSDQSWLDVNPLSGTGDNTLTFSANTNNITSARTALVTVSSPGSPSRVIEVTQNLLPKTVVINAGELSTVLTAVELGSLTTLTITGTIDARDFKTMRDRMPLLTNIDLSKTKIAAYFGIEGTLTFSTGYSANVIPSYAFSSNSGVGKTGLMSILLPETTTKIDAYAFTGCTGLTSFSIPSSVNAMGYYAFYNCINLTSLYVNSNIPVDFGDNWSAFFNINKTNCTLYVPYATKLLYASALVWKDFTNISENPHGFFIGSKKINLEAKAGSSANLAIKSNLTWSISSDQSWLTVNPVSGTGDSILTFTATANENATQRKATVTITAPECTSQSLEVTQNVAPKSIDITAGGLLTALTTDELNSITTLIITGTIDARDFKTMRDKMPLLANIDLTGASIAAYSGTEGTYAYTSIYAANLIPHYAFFNYLLNTGKSGLKSILIPGSVTAIGNCAFNNCTGLTSFTIPSSVNTIGSSVFYNCTAMTSLTVQASYPVDLNNNYSVFYNINKTSCTLNVPFGAKSIYTAAFQWYSFTNIVENSRGFIPGTNKIKLAYKEGSSTTTSLTGNVSWNVSSDQSWLTVTPASGTGNSTLTFTAGQNDSTNARTAKVSINSPDFGTQIITVNQTGFPKTVNITAGGLLTSLTTSELSNTADLIITGTMDARDFKTLRDNMPALAFLDLSGVSVSGYTGADGTSSNSSSTSQYPANAIPTYAFYNSNYGIGKTGLISIKMPTTATTIGYYAFRGCSGLTSLTFPNSIKTISFNSFQDCTGLTSIYAKSVYPIELEISSQVFYNVNKTSCILYVPYGSKSLYSSALQWKDFTSIVEDEQGFLVGSRTIKFPSSVESKSISVMVKSNVTWTAQSDHPWLVVNHGINPNDSTLTLVAGANPTDTIRTAVITVSATGYDSQTIDVIQSAAPRKITAGGLLSALTANELATTAELTLMGTIDARDFITMRDKMPSLASVDLTNVNVVGYEGTAGTIIGTFNKYPENEIPKMAFNYKSSLKSIKLPTSIISVGEYAFSSASNLTSVTFANKLKSLGIYSFAACTGLSTVNLPDSLSTIGEFAFYNCTNLAGTLTIPSLVKSIGAGAYLECSKLTSLEILAPIDSIRSSTFYDCRGLTSVKLPISLKTIENSAFAYCSNLKAINLPTSITSLGSSAFKCCMRLSSVYFPESLSAIGDESFYYTGIVSLTIPSTLTDIGKGAFSSCLSLNSISLPSTLKQINNSVFSGCTAITSLPFSTTLEVIGDNAFSGCTGLTNITFASTLKTLGASAFASCTAIKTVGFPSSLTTIGANAFSGCTGLTSIDIPSTVTSIAYQAFSGCKGLISVKLPSTLVTLENGVFSSCEGLPSMIIPPSVKTIGKSTFYNCKLLTTVNIPASVEIIDEGAFSNCTSLPKIDIPLGVKIIGTNAFNYCVALTSIVIPSSVINISSYAFNECSALRSVQLPENIQTLGDYAFYDCYSLSAINLPNTIKSIGSNCFMGCTGLRSVVIPPLIQNISYLTFANCVNLTSVTLNSTLRSLDSYAFVNCGFNTIILPNTLKNIEYEAFADCKNLTNITIPSSVTKIDDHAFSSCINLKSINIPAAVTEIGPGAFSNCPSISTIYAYPLTPVDMTFSGDGFYGVNKNTCTLYVPIGKKDAYRASTYWKDFTNIIEMTTAVPSLNDANVSLYPNPIKDTFSIKGIDGAVTVSICDVSGKILLMKQVVADETISVSSFPKGIYVLKITNREGFIERKIMKQ